MADYSYRYFLQDEGKPGYEQLLIGPSPNLPYGSRELSLLEAQTYAKQATNPLISPMGVTQQAISGWEGWTTAPSTGFADVPGVGTYMNPQQVQQSQQLQQQVVSGAMKETTPGSGMYVPTGSPAAAQLAGQTQEAYLQTPEAKAFLAANPGVIAVNPQAPVSMTTGTQLTVSKPYYRVQGTNEVYSSKTGAHITAEEAAKIPNFWSQVEETTQKPTGFSPSPEYTDTITAEKMAGEQMIDLGGGVTTSLGSIMGSGTLAAADQAAKSIAEYIKILTPEETPKSKEAQTLTDRISALLGESAGEATMLVQEQEKAGVTQMTQQFKNLQNEIMTKTAAFNQLYADIQGKPITMNSIIGAEAQARKVAEADIGFLTAQAQAMQNNIAFAKQTAQQAVDNKYNPIEEELNIKLKQLELLQPFLDREETIQAQAQQLYLQQQQQQLADIKANEKTLINYNLDAMTKYPSAGIRTTDTFEATNQKVLNSAEYKAAMQGEKVETWSDPYMLGGDLVQRSSTTGQIRTAVNIPAGTPQDIPSALYNVGLPEEPLTKFTDTQINKGAATADIPIADFIALDADTKNFFINNSSEINSMKKAIVDAKDNKEDPTAIEKEISESNAPDSVKDTLIKYLWSVFPRPTTQTKKWYEFWK